MTIHRVDIHRDRYVDSVGLLNVSRDMRDVPGVVKAEAIMGTAANLELLRKSGFEIGDAEPPRANDLVIAVTAEGEDAAVSALEVARETIRGSSQVPAADSATVLPKSLDDAIGTLGDANLALISVPGAYAALETQKALTAGLHVLLFSDNVSLPDEVTLKTRAAELGLLVMGPGAGTAMLGGTGLGFANVVRRGPVRVVAAAGTGAQEAMTLLDRWGSGVSEVIGVGGRDLSHEVNGAMTRLAIAATGGGSADGSAPVVLVVSKPPDPGVAETVLGALEKRSAVCAFIGLDQPLRAPQGVRLASTLEQAVLETLDLLGMPVPDPGTGLSRVAAAAAATLGRGRRAVRGLYSGGTLCYEAMGILSKRLGAVYSNTPLRPEWALPAPTGAHVCLDLGDEEYTRHGPHPMINPMARADELEHASTHPTTAVLLVDVVLGHGAHPDPAGKLVEILGHLGPRDNGPVVVAYVLGTEQDPQTASEQRALLVDAGYVVAPTGARAALLAAAIATRRPEVAEDAP